MMVLLFGCTRIDRLPVEEVERITVNVFVNGNLNMDSMFERLGQKFSNMDFQYYYLGNSAYGKFMKNRFSHINDALNAQIYPDLFVESMDLTPIFVKYGIALDLNPYTSTNNIELNRIQSEYLGHIKAWSKGDEYFAFPVQSNLMLCFTISNYFEKAGSNFRAMV